MSNSGHPGNQPPRPTRDWLPPVQSPVTGETGDGTAWVRLAPDSIGFPVPTLFVDERDVAFIGLDDRGFELVGERDPGVPVPEITTIGVDLWSRHDVDLTDTSDKSDPKSWTRFAGAAFVDPHPEEWWASVHEAGWLVTVIGDPTPFIRDEWPEDRMGWVKSLWVGQLPLTVRAWNDGIGTARSDQI